MWARGLGQFLTFLATVLAILLTDLLVGVLVGLAISAGCILVGKFRR
jgi:carbonic anhydrase/SulP family sulfate permease